MRGQFFAYLGMGLLCLIFFYCVWLVLRALWSVIADTLENREMDQLANEYIERRESRRIEEADRLDNGCEHEYGHILHALPDEVCNRCGLARERPLGACDHVWRVLPGVIPESECELCGKKYGTLVEQ